jgi:hypothetical protein
MEMRSRWNNDYSAELFTVAFQFCLSLAVVLSILVFELVGVVGGGDRFDTIKQDQFDQSFRKMSDYVDRECPSPDLLTSSRNRCYIVLRSASFMPE